MRLPQIVALFGWVSDGAGFSDGGVAVAVVELSVRVDVVQSFAAVPRPGVLKPNLNDARREIQFLTQTVDLVTFGARLHGEVTLQHLHVQQSSV